MLSRLRALLPKRPAPAPAPESPELVPALVRRVKGDPLLGARFDSDTWEFVAKRAEEELAALRVKNDDVRLSELETAVVRGRIKQLKRLLALPETVKNESRAALAQRGAPSDLDD